MNIDTKMINGYVVVYRPDHPNAFTGSSHRGYMYGKCYDKHTNYFNYIGYLISGLQST